MNILDFEKKKIAGEKIAIITCYDYTSARLLSETATDCLLVGDSLGMTMHGFDSTLPVTIEMMVMHTAAVVRGAGDKFIVADMPFLSFRKSLSKNVDAAGKLMQAGAHAVKLEGAAGNLKLIRHLVDSGIPVMGHLGLTPQSVNAFGGYKVQGKTVESAQRLKTDALALQAAGCFAMVLECVPTELAREITASLSIATIGIGAGADTDGQVLVLQDLLGLNLDLKPKFSKQFINGATLLKEGFAAYVNAVKTGDFPNDQHSYHSQNLAPTTSTTSAPHHRLGTDDGQPARRTLETVPAS